MKLSIITTLYNSAPYIEEFYKRIISSAKKITDDYEIIFVNDGSPDTSLEIANDLYEKDPKVKIIDLSRNFGHHKAIMTGLQYAAGDYIFLIDSDLEEKPEWLKLFWDRLKEEENNDVDVIYGVQKSRKGNFIERITGNIFYWLFNKLAHINLTSNIVTCRLTSKRYNNALIEHKEREIFLVGLWEITGFKQIPIRIEKYSTSPTNYSFFKKISILLNAFTAFSNILLKGIFYLGTVVTLCSFLYAFFIIIRKFILKIDVPGWTSIIVSVWFLSGIIIAILGIIGLYLSKIYSEVKQRPYTIIRKVYSNEQ
jgi:putative glycosyltransferase